jgi:hypothetical protein
VVAVDSDQKLAAGIGRTHAEGAIVGAMEPRIQYAKTADGVSIALSGLEHWRSRARAAVRNWQPH